MRTSTLLLGLGQLLSAAFLGWPWLRWWRRQHQLPAPRHTGPLPPAPPYRPEHGLLALVFLVLGVLALATAWLTR
jgi:hypothetical protein